MKAHLFLQRFQANLQHVQWRALGLSASRMPQPTAPVAAAPMILRRPSRRIVAELTSLLGISPVVLGLSALVALPWPEQTTRPAPRPSVYGALASLASSSGARAPARLGTASKISDRAPAAAAQRAPDPEPDRNSAPAVDRFAREAGHAAIADGGHLIIDGEQVRLDGIEMPDASATCRRLDGVEVRCIDRAVARLSIIAQQGELICRTKIDAAGGRTARCLVGKIDLAQDLVRAQLARRLQSSTLELGI